MVVAAKYDQDWNLHEAMKILMDEWRVGHSFESDPVHSGTSFVIIKQITMTNTYNIAGADGNVMVPELYETGCLMAYLLYPDPTGMLGELYGS